MRRTGFDPDVTPDRAPESRDGAGSPAMLRVLALLLLLAGVIGAPSASAHLPLSHAGPGSAAPGVDPFGPNETVSGRVVDDYSGQALPNVTVRSIDYTGQFRVTHADAFGRFTVESVPGTVYITVDPPKGYAGTQVRVAVDGAPVTGVVIGLVPTGVTGPLSASSVVDGPVLLGIGVGALAAVGVGAAAVRRRRIEEGGSGRLLSRFGRYVVTRSLLIPLQLVAVLIVLYVFGTFLPALAIAHRTGCLSLNGGACAPCPPSELGCQLSAFGPGLYQFLASILTGQWGIASFGGGVRLPAVDFVAWWLPNSLQLAGFALLLSLAIGYPLGLAAGWRADGVLDRSLRSLSVLLLLVPTFLVVLFLLNAIYTPWLGGFGDSPYDLYPSQDWQLAHGGIRPWIGVEGQSTPTGFPLIDGSLKGDWAFVSDITAKLLLQALAIAVIYVSIFFRFARHAIAEAARSEAIRAARARGVSEATLAWHHSGRRVLPVLLLIFGATLPVYVGTQALVEVLFSDTRGFGTILFTEMTQVGSVGFGVLHRGQIPLGNLYQVTIFFLAALLLVGNLCADVLARMLDHSLEAPEDR